ncbi:MAG: serine hydrolase [Verrucomicrobiota bacterium]
MRKLLLPLLLLLTTSGLVPVRADEALDKAIDSITPDIKKWATVCVVTRDAAGAPVFTWTDYKNTGEQQDFWPCSTIKLYAVVAALELLTEKGFPLDTIVTFSHQEKAGGAWVTDSSRTVREMLSEVFRTSSNEDYTLLLRMVGIDRINTRFFIPEKGYTKTALMRGYVLGRPWVYKREEPQRVQLTAADGSRTETMDHTWTGHSYAADRGATIIDSKTGNVTTTRELVECLRRILHHEHLPEKERYALSPEMLAFLREGGGGLTGLENKSKESGAYSWIEGTEKVLPQARFYHKCGSIETYALEIAAVDDSKQGGPVYLLAPATDAGTSTKPVTGPRIISDMSIKIAEWAKAGAGDAPKPAPVPGK